MSYPKLALLITAIATAVYLLGRRQQTVVVKEIQAAVARPARRQKLDAFMGISQ
jgi:hypothetical protein